MIDLPGVKRHVGTDPVATLLFVAEAAAAGYRQVVLAADVADALVAAVGGPFTSSVAVVRSTYVSAGLAVALPSDLEIPR